LRLEKAIIEANRWELDASRAQDLLAEEEMAEKGRLTEERERASRKEKEQAKRELKLAMPGWVSRADVPRLERAIEAAYALGVDVSDARSALEKEQREAALEQRREAAAASRPLQLSGDTMPALEFGAAAHGREILTVSIPWPPKTPEDVLGITIDDSKEEGLGFPPVITAIRPVGLCIRSGILQIGDLVGAVNGQKVYSHIDAASLIQHSPGELNLTILRSQAEKMPVKMGRPLPDTVPVVMGHPVLDDHRQ